MTIYQTEQVARNNPTPGAFTLGNAPITASNPGGVVGIGESNSPLMVHTSSGTFTAASPEGKAAWIEHEKQYELAKATGNETAAQKAAQSKTQSQQNIASANRLLPSINLKLEGKIPLTGGETYLSLFKSKQTLEGAKQAESKSSGVSSSYGYNPKLSEGLELFGAYYGARQAQVTPELAFQYSTGKVQMGGTSMDVSREYQAKYTMPSFEDYRNMAIRKDVESIMGVQGGDLGFFITPREGGGAVGLLANSKQSYFNIFEHGVKEANRTGQATYIGGLGITYYPTITNYGSGILNETTREIKERGYTAEEGRQFELVKAFGKGEHPITLNMQTSLFGRTRMGMLGVEGRPPLLTQAMTGYIISTDTDRPFGLVMKSPIMGGFPEPENITQSVMFNGGGMATYEKSKTEAWQNYYSAQAQKQAETEAAQSGYIPVTNETTNIVSQTADKYSNWTRDVLGAKTDIIGSMFPAMNAINQWKENKSKGGIGLFDATGFLAQGGRNYITIYEAGKQNPAGQARINVRAGFLDNEAHSSTVYEFGALPLRLTGGLLQAPDYTVREMAPYAISRGAVTYQFAGETLFNKLVPSTINVKAGFLDSEAHSRNIHPAGQSDLTTQFFEFSQFESRKPILYESIINLAAGSGVMGGIVKTGTATFASFTPAPEVASTMIGGFTDIGFKAIYATSMVMAPEETMKSTGLLMAPSLSQNLPIKGFNVELVKGKSIYQGFVSQLSPFEGNVIGRVNGKWVIGQGNLASTIKAQPNEFFVGRIPPSQLGGTKGGNIADVMNFAQYKTYKTGIIKPISEKYEYPEMYNRMNVMEGLSRTAYNLPEPSVQQDIPEAVRSSDWFKNDLTPAQQNRAINYLGKARTGLEYYGGTALKTTNPTMKGAGETDIDVMMRNSLGNVLSVNNPGRFNRGLVNTLRGKPTEMGNSNIRVSPDNPNAVEIYSTRWKALGEKGPWIKRFDVHGMFGEPLPEGTVQLGSGEGIGFGLPAKPEMMTPRGYFIMRPSEQIVRYFSSASIPRMDFTGVKGNEDKTKLGQSNANTIKLLLTPNEKIRFDVARTKLSEFKTKDQFAHEIVLRGNRYVPEKVSPAKNLEGKIGHETRDVLRSYFEGNTIKQYEISMGGEPKRVYRAASQLDIQAKEPLSRRLYGVVNKDEIAYAKTIGFEYTGEGPKSVPIVKEAKPPKQRGVLSFLRRGAIQVDISGKKSRGISRSTAPRSLTSIARSISPRSVSPSLSRSISMSRSPSMSRSMSSSLSQSISMSRSPSMSRSISQSLSRSISMSRSPSMSKSISPSMSMSRSLSKSLSPSMSPSIRSPPSPPKIPGLNITFPFEKARGKKSGGKRGSRKYGYAPSLTAGIFNITGKVSSSILSGKQQISGLELRPLVRGGRKTKYKMGRFR
jgi:hypothetical protein